MKVEIAFLAGLLALGGCGGRPDGVVEGAGGAVGALAAAAPTGQANSGAVTASIISAMDGGLVGGAIGADLDRSEKQAALEAEYKALEYTPGGQTVEWGNKAAGRYGEVVAASPYRVGSQDCRQYAHIVYTGGQPKKARGTACRNPDGGWTPLT